MNATEEIKDSWDFSPVYDLLQRFSISGGNDVTPRDYRSSEKEASGDSSSSFDQPETPDWEALDTGLGNFEKIWEYLGQPLNVPPPVVQADNAELSYPAGSGSRGPKIVKWRDEVDGADLTDNNDTGDLPDILGLTKTQRKKANRKRRKAVAERFGPGTAAAASTSSGNESDNEDKKEPTPDSKGVIYRLLHGSNPMQDGTPDTRRMGVVKRSQPLVEPETWPVAKPHASKGDSKTSSQAASSAYAAAAARKAALMTMLNERFPDERQYLNSISLFPRTYNDLKSTAEGLHVFIDASNIMIGLHDAFKVSRSLPKEQFMRRLPFSFHSLSLLLTRGRPTSKLVLVGSDNFPAITEAKTLGYETNILDRVHKAKELTIRQKHFSKSGRGDHSAGSGSETGLVATHADKKWVEQAVDEILHLKMMESIVDCTEPGTMILGSGDAAEAEYSGGFLKMVERALGKGWKVEVACFKANMSGMYRRKEFKDKWARMFKLVELDDFVEVLLGSE